LYCKILTDCQRKKRDFCGTEIKNMKRFFSVIALILFGLTANSQNPVTWTFTAKKTADKTYEVHMTATIQSGWHLYSQTQPEDAIAIPTTFTLTANPLFTADGAIKELDLSANQYSKKVDFVQIVKLKSAAKTNFSGNVEYQTCDDKKCLPPKTVNFSIALK
jgi:thiol:disulfide interchange protein DsbD